MEFYKKGKTVLLSSLTPFASVTSLDERSSLSYITPGKSGYKEIHYVDGDNEYIIKHYYKPTKDSHTVKSYFQMNGERFWLLEARRVFTTRISSLIFLYTFRYSSISSISFPIYSFLRA